MSDSPINKAIFWTGFILLGLGAALVAFTYYAAYATGGKDAIMELASPKNLEGHIYTLITLAPGIICLIWARSAKQKGRR